MEEEYKEQIEEPVEEEFEEEIDNCNMCSDADIELGWWLS